MSLHWFNPPVSVRTGKPGITYSCNNVWVQLGNSWGGTIVVPNGTLRCAPACPVWLAI